MQRLLGTNLEVQLNALRIEESNTHQKDKDGLQTRRCAVEFGEMQPRWMLQTRMPLQKVPIQQRQEQQQHGGGGKKKKE